MEASAGRVRFDPQAAIVGFNSVAADAQPHAQTVLLAAGQGLEYLAGHRCIDTRAAVEGADLGLVVHLSRDDGYAAASRVRVADGVDGVAQQIEQRLLDMYVRPITPGSVSARSSTISIPLARARATIRAQVLRTRVLTPAGPHRAAGAQQLPAGDGVGCDGAERLAEF
jgi:hypothetical protein